MELILITQVTKRLLTRRLPLKTPTTQQLLKTQAMLQLLMSHLKTTSSVKSNAANPALVAKLKADSDNRMQQLQSLVTTMFKKQGITIGTADDMWKALASGNFTADADTIAKAKEDISEDGYWGVKQTSERIFDFAQALAGDDEEKMKTMKEAVEKGFKEATKSWGRTLPDISQDTYSAVMDKFDKYFASKNTDSTNA